MHSSAVSRAGIRAVLLAIVVVAALLLSMAAMHASMLDAHRSGGHMQATGAQVMAMPAAAVTQAGVGASAGHAMGNMNLADCLLLGMVCFLTAAAVLLLTVVIRRLRSLLRPCDATYLQLAHSLRTAAGRLRPPEPPSLLVLSISRT